MLLESQRKALDLQVTMLIGVTTMKQQYRLLTTPKSKVTCNIGLICPALALILTASDYQQHSILTFMGCRVAD